jgi:glycosyltransferase involved in cell wall biosynthesis
LKAGFLHQDLNICGGRELVAISMIECLRKQGFDTILFTGRKVDNFRIKQYFGKTVQIDKEIVIRLWRHNIQTYFEFLLAGLAKKYCEILINPFTSDILPYVDITYIHYPKPLVLAKKAESHSLWHLLYKPYQRLETTLSYRASQKLILANSFFTANAVKKQFGIDPLVIYPPVNIEKLIHGSFEGKKNLVLTISRFSFDKGLEQIPYLAKKVNAKFVILGSVYSQHAYYVILNLIRKLDVGERVTLITNASLEKKIELLQKAKVYLHTTPYEHFGISVVEGMAAGCISVTPNSGGPTEYVPAEWRYNDEEDAAQKIIEALDKWSPSTGEKMKSIAYSFREQRFQDHFYAALQSYLMAKN